MAAPVIVVNHQDQILGEKERNKAHQINSLLHRGFITFIKNKKKEILLLKRNSQKLFGHLWDGCCSHPQMGETYVQAGQRRLEEELGFTCPLKQIGKFYYRAVDQNNGTEEEICAVLTGHYNGNIKPNKNEVINLRWLTLEDLKKEIKQMPLAFTPWLIKSLKFLRQAK